MRVDQAVLVLVLDGNASLYLDWTVQLTISLNVSEVGEKVGHFVLQLQQFWRRHHPSTHHWASAQLALVQPQPGVHPVAHLGHQPPAPPLPVHLVNNNLQTGFTISLQREVINIGILLTT